MGTLQKTLLSLLLIAFAAMGAGRARAEHEEAAEESDEAAKAPEVRLHAEDDAESDAESQAGSSAESGAESEPPLYRAHGERPRGITALQPGDVSVATTRVELGDRLASGEELREVLAEIPSARISSSGGDGQYATLGLRGTEFNHSVVLLDDRSEE